MRKRGILALTFLATAFLFALAFADNHTPEDRGKIHFDNPSLAGGKKSCSSCHENGKLLKHTAGKTEFRVVGGRRQISMETAINACIVIGNGGDFIDDESAEMKELSSYIKSIGKKK